MRLGLRVEAPIDLHGWKVIDIDANVPLTTVFACPADGATMRTLCTFTSDADPVRVRLGCCPTCGHVAYVDRPTEAWMNQYYLESWDANDVQARTENRQGRLLSTRKREKTVVTVAKSLDVDKRRPVCEIGSGWGVSLRHLMEGGFSRVVGTEASKHRAAVVRAGLGVPVYTAPFESTETQQALAEQGPFSIVVSNHVLEHTFHPGNVIEAAASLQREGDYLIVAVPNQETEQVMSVFFFLPHLHSFTQASLERTAARCGYAVVNNKYIHPKQLLLVLRKTDRTFPEKSPIAGVFERAVEKYTKELALDQWRAGLRRLWWLRRGGLTGQRWMMGSGPIEKARWARWVERQGYDLPRSIAVRSLGRRRTTVEESQFEIQFGGPVGLFCK